MKKGVILFMGLLLLLPVMAQAAEQEDVGAVRAVKRTFQLDINKCDDQFWGKKKYATCAVTEFEHKKYEQTMDGTSLKVLLHDQNLNTCRLSINTFATGYIMTVQIADKFEISAFECAHKAFKKLKTKAVEALVYTIVK